MPVGASGDQPSGNWSTYFAWFQMLEPIIRARRSCGSEFGNNTNPYPFLKHVSNKRWGKLFFSTNKMSVFFMIKIMDLLHVVP